MTTPVFRDDEFDGLAPYVAAVGTHIDLLLEAAVAAANPNAHQKTALALAVTGVLFAKIAEEAELDPTLAFDEITDRHDQLGLTPNDFADYFTSVEIFKDL